MNYAKLFRGNRRDFGFHSSETPTDRRVATAHFLLTCRIALTIWLEENNQQPSTTSMWNLKEAQNETLVVDHSNHIVLWSDSVS